MRTRRKGRWLPKQPRLGARMCQGQLLIPLLFLLNALGGLDDVIYGQSLADYISVILSIVLWRKCKTYNSARKS